MLTFISYVYVSFLSLKFHSGRRRPFPVTKFIASPECANEKVVYYRVP